MSRAAAGREEPRLLVVHGPGLDLDRRGLETPAPGSLEALAERLAGWASAVGARVSSVEARAEGEAVEAVGAAGPGADGVVVVAGESAFTSDALAGAVAAAGVPVVDLHLSDLRAAGRDAATSRLARAGARVIHGRGIEGYRWALAHLAWQHAWPPVTTSAYGSAPGQAGDLRVPPGPGPHRVAMLLHGGFWLDAWERDLLDGLAVDLARRGWATWNVEYRRVGGGGGWPASFADVEAALAHVRALAAGHGLDPAGMLLAGHSAGGHLALRLAAEMAVRRRRGEPGHGGTPPVEIDGVLALAPLADLAAARAQRLGGGAVDRFLGGSALADAGPLAHLPLGVPQLVVHCADDALVPESQSGRWTAAARAAGDDVTLVTLPTGGHFAPVTPGTAAWDAAVALLPGAA